MTGKIKDLNDVLMHELKDLYSAEKQLIKALPKMAKAASAEELQECFEDHLEETKNQVNRIEEAFEKLGKKATSQKCKAMEGLIEEGEEGVEDSTKGEARDALLIAAAQKVEHYEIASYGAARDHAEKLGHRDVAKLLNQTLSEEKKADERLNKLALQEINEAAIA